VSPDLPSIERIDDLIRRALEEDLDAAGDITTAATVPPGHQASAVIAARKAGVMAGIPVARRVFQLVDPKLKVTERVNDGATVAPGDVVLALDGDAASILIGERVALNFLGRLSGVATATSALVKAVAHTRARICCTRKTTPGLRALEKYAVRCGGAVNHRMGLYDAILIKDNHIAAAGGVREAIRAARKAVGKGTKLEVEVDTLAQLDEVLAEGVDQVLLDNVTPVQMKEAVGRIGGRAIAEASGSITAATAGAIAESGVDLLSVGWITHSAPCLDLGLDFKSGL
jgi:nicotinate-nucleotide pyrophosphorylase (carboxylating)